jgi:hypothetical protein
MKLENGDGKSNSPTTLKDKALRGYMGDYAEAISVGR